MSVSYLKFVPENEHFLPNADQEHRLKNLLYKQFLPDSIQFNSTEKITFIDQGSNFEDISCPVCQTVLEINWWQERMSRTFGMDNIDLEIVTPCCKTKSSLNRLVYNMPAGFGRYEIRLEEPDDKSIIVTLKNAIETILETEIKVIIARY